MQIPDSVSQAVCEQEKIGKTNVLLLALSTLPITIKKTIEKSDFCVGGDEKNKIEGCIGQMEPVVKLRLKENPLNNPLKIIALCTEAVSENEESFSVDDIEYKETTAEKFFTDRVKEFGKEKNVEVSVDVISLDENNPNKGIREAVKTIREMKNEMAELWIDPHGGFRDVAMTMNAIISLLRVDEIEPDKIYKVKYGNNKKSIEEQENKLSIFDFVSGMNEFIDYGSVNILNRYYENNESRPKELLDAMDKVAKGTRECDIIMYEEGLDALGESLESLDKSDSLLAIFKEYVEKSYGDLLYKETRTTTALVKRCLDKGLIQQALTFIESRMPEDFVNKYLVYCREGELHSKGLAQKDRSENNHREYYKSDDNFIIDNFVSFVYSNYNEEDFEKNFTDAENMNKKNFMKEKEGGEKIIKDIDKKEFIVCTRLKPEKYADAGKLMYMHRALKQCRNKFNHCDPDRPESNDIKRVMEAYITLAEELLNNEDNYNEEDPKETLQISAKTPKDAATYTFVPCEITRSKKGIKGILSENKETAVLNKNDMKDTTIGSDGLKQYIENKESIKVTIKAKHPQQELGKFLVKEV